VDTDCRDRIGRKSDDSTVISGGLFEVIATRRNSLEYAGLKYRYKKGRNERLFKFWGVPLTLTLTLTLTLSQRERELQARQSPVFRTLIYPV